MTDSLVERMARAIENQMMQDDCAPEDLARAALVEARVPTEQMVSAANRNNHPRDIDTWQTMIDEALKEAATMTDTELKGARDA
jgi:hypothetical protein